MNSKNTYAAAGVDIEAGNSLVERIKPLAKATARIGSNTDLGGFGGLFDLKACGYNDPVLVSGTDGVGTKLKIAQDLGIHNTIGIDLVAMCVNDVVVQGAEALFFLDYFACGKLDVQTAEDVVAGIAEGCKQAGCALIGGETAEMPGMYDEGEYDLAGFTVGAVERDQILPQNNIESGDAIIAIASSGIHSNGYSLVRKILADNNIAFADKVDAFDKPIGEVLLTPTKIYVKQCLELIKQVDVKAFAHITGGGITENLPRVFKEGIGADIDLSSWELPLLFKWLKKKGDIEEQELLKTFNCGVGMIAVIPESDVEGALKVLESLGEEAFVIGKITDKEGVNYINSDN